MTNAILKRFLGWSLPTRIGIIIGIIGLIFGFIPLYQYLENNKDIVNINKNIAEMKAVCQGKTDNCLTEQVEFSKEKILRLAKTLNESAKNNFEKGLAAFNLGEFNSAIYLLNESFNSKIEPIISSFIIGASYSSLRKYNESIYHFDKTLEMNSNFYLAHFGKGISLFELGKYEESIKSYNKALQINPNFKEAYTNKADALKELKKYKESLEELDKALKIDPKFNVAWNGKGITLDNMGKFNESLMAFNKALELDNNYKEAWYGRGLALLKLGKYNESITSFNNALKLDPNDIQTLYDKGYAYFLLSKYEDSLYLFDRVLEINPRDVKALIMKGIALNYLGRHKKSLESLNMALEINAYSEEALIEKGRSLAGLKRFNESVKFFDKVLDINPNSKEALQNKNISLMMLDRYQDVTENDSGSLFYDCPYVKNRNDINKTLPNGTLAIMVAPEELTLGEDHYVLDMIDYDDNSFLELFITGTEVIKVRMHDSSNLEFTLSFNHKLPLKKWTHLAVSWGENDYIKLYVDSKVKSSISIKDANFNIPLKTWYIASSHKKESCLSGSFDDFILWGNILNQSEIYEEYLSKKDKELP